MSKSALYQADVDAIRQRRHDNGGDFWSTADGRWGVGSPFSTFDCILILTELGVKRSDPLLKGAADVIFNLWQSDGRIRPAPTGAVYPCHTANAARALCRLGLARDKRLRQTFDHLLETQHSDGGWRCNTVKMGRSPQTDASNPGVTLAALDAFRFSPMLNGEKRLDKAVKFLLGHWRSRKPLGPCEFGIGTLFNKVEYPFLRYNLFYYAYVLSFYDAAKSSAAMRAVRDAMEAKIVNRAVIVENPNRRLAKLDLCRKGEPSKPATRRYREMMKNLAA